jgi:Protein of unknown function (DUF4232)
MMRRHLLRLLLGVLAAGAVLGAGLEMAAAPLREGFSTNGMTAALAADVLTICSPNQLSVSLGQNLAGAGNRVFVILFENISSSTCLLRGYPTVVGVDASGHWVGSTRHTPTDGALAEKERSVRLRPGHRGSTLLQTIGVKLNGATCFTYQSILVRSPHTRRYFRVPLKWKLGQGPETNGLGVCGTVFVDPVTPGVETLF